MQGTLREQQGTFREHCVTHLGGAGDEGGACGQQDGGGEGGGDGVPQNGVPLGLLGSNLQRAARPASI